MLEEGTSSIYIFITLVQKWREWDFQILSSFKIPLYSLENLQKIVYLEIVNKVILYPWFE